MVSHVTAQGSLKDAVVPVPSLAPTEPDPAKVETTPADDIFRMVWPYRLAM